MATIDELHWSVILDTKEFDKAIKDIEEKAQRMNVRVSELLSVNGKYQQFLKDVQNLVKHQKDAAAVQKDINEQTRAHNRALLEQSGILKQLSGLAGTYFSVRGAKEFFEQLVKVTGEFESQRIALESMLGSSDKADEIFRTLRKMSLESPYTLQDLTKYAKQLTAFNIEADELAETEKRLADVAAGLGVDMGRIILAYGQIKSAGVLKGTELRQLTEAGVPILDSLAKQIEEVEGKAVSLAEIYSRISKKQIPFAMVEKAFKDMTSEGGKFYNMQAELVETLKGKIGKLRDVWQQTLYDIGSEGTMNELLKGSVDTVTRLVAGFENLGRVVMEAVAVFGAYKAALLVAEACAARLTVQETIASVAAGTLNKVTKVLNKTLLVNPYAAIAAGVATLVFAIYKAVTAESALDKQMKGINKTVESFNAKIADETSTLDYLFGNLERATKGTKEYEAAKKQLLNRYDDYLTATDREALRVGNLAGVYDRLKTSIIEANRARALEEGTAGITKTFTDSFNEISKAFQRNFKERPVERGVMQELGDYLFGRNGKTEDNLSEKAKKYIKDVNDAIGAVMNTPGGMFGNGLSTSLVSIDQLKTRLNEAEKAANDARGALADSLELIYGPQKETKKNSAGISAVKGATKEEENRIKARIALLQKYKDTFDKLAQNPLVGSDTAKEMMSLFYGIEDTNFAAQISDLADALLRLNPELAEYAEGVRASFGKDAADEYLKAVSAFGQLEKEVEEFLSKDFGTEGEKVAYKISKVLNDLLNADIKADLKVNQWARKLEETKPKIMAEYRINNKDILSQVGENMQEQLAQAYWEEYKKRRIAEWKAQAKQQKEAGRRDAENAIRGFAKEIFADATSSYDLTDWSEKSLFQILRIKKAMGEIDLPDDVKEALADNLELADQLLADLKEMAEKKVEQTINPEIVKKLGSDAQRLAGYMDQAAKSMRELADASGDQRLTDLADELSSFSQNLSAAGQGAASGGWVGAIIGGATDMIEQTITAFAQAAAEEREATNNARDYANALQLIADTARDEAFISVFGESALGKVKENIRAAKDALSDYGDALARLNAEYNEQLIEPDLQAPVAALFLPGIPFGKKLPSDFKAYQDAIQKGYEGLQRMLVKTKDRSGWAKFWGAQDEYTALADLAPDIWKDGAFDVEAAKTFLSTNTQITEEQRKQLQGVIDLKEAYEDAVAEIDSVVEDMFGGLADNMVDIFIENFTTIGDAVDDLGDAFKDLGTTIARSLLKSFVLDEILKKHENDARGIVADDITAEERARLISQMTDKIADDVEQYRDTINAILTAFQSEGLLQGGTPAEGLAEGIKGITEDTAGLLASYINAIRSDVAMIRSLASVGWEDVRGIRGYMPTLADSIANIAAHNADIQESNREIALYNQRMLEEIRSVISTSSGSRAIKVDVQ